MTTQEFERKTNGSPIKRIGYERWLRNLAVGLGNSKAGAQAVDALQKRRGFSPLVDEHIDWAISQLAAH